MYVLVIEKKLEKYQTELNFPTYLLQIVKKLMIYCQVISKISEMQMVHFMPMNKRPKQVKSPTDHKDHFHS